ncbi:olfactory receptor 51L1-like [Sarcophilus harrisii]|uniref:olfactory receptor 51L1-like n=1 Tax=Sarcophilus harrisii TaxID=9305 RepID=UPI000273AB03|nr:olfactory receptor 51L1-like [Sarcophilus harrisii]
MSPHNHTHSDVLTFLLPSFPGPGAPGLLSILGLTYSTTLLGNGLLLLTICANTYLHQPQFSLLALLATTDLGLALSMLPTILDALWFPVPTISRDVCILQMCCLYTISTGQSSVLLAMALDRWLAVCHPLYYLAFFTPSRLAWTSLAFILRATIPLLPTPLLISSCSTCNLSLPFCFPTEVLQLSCGGRGWTYLAVSLLTTVSMDIVLITIFYCLVLWEVVKRVSPPWQHKALRTFTAHLCALLVFYGPLFVSALFPGSLPGSFVSLGLLASPAIHPLVYGIQSHRLRRGMLGALGCPSTLRVAPRPKRSHP